VRSGFVGILGWTNVGKSTLLNALVGEKLAATSRVPQTTRNRITGVLHLDGKGQIVFVDTPGFHRPRYRMNHAMIDVSRSTLRSVDAALMIVDGERGLGPGDRETARLLSRADLPSIIAVNKIDRIRPKTRLFPILQEIVEVLGFPAAVPISALHGDGTRQLVEEVLKILPERDPVFPRDYLTDQPERTLVAEAIREKIFQLTREEIPHSVAVLIDHWEEGPSGLRIGARILVEKDSQKAIVIGKGGELLKKVGTRARLEMERFLDARIHLDLWVKVRQGWRNDPDTLHRIGL